jgi:ATP-dependent helicase/nuclease subunit A
MSATQFTPAQLEAATPGRKQLDICVVAGPGSGKTTVLVEYFQRLVEGGADPLRILAITFTEKAAGNLRQKLAQAFHSQAETRARLERAWVSTVHGFCSRLLRENAVFAGVDPQFYVAEERESWRWQHEAISDAVAELFSEQPAPVRALIRGLSSAEFEEALLSAYDAMRCAGQTIQHAAALAPPNGVSQQDIAETLRALRNDPLPGWSASQREQRGIIVEDAQRIRDAAGPLEALRAIEDYSGNLRKCKQGTLAYNLASRLRKQIDELPYSLVSELYRRERETLLEIFRRFDTLYRERKRKAGALDFADLEEAAVRLLEESAETRARLQAQFDHILMDEFQDTNGQQSRLLDLIRRTDRFYAVGDINQSIFGFRHAEPEVFRKYRGEVEREGKRLIELVENFRSRAEILRAVESVAFEAGGIEARTLVAGRKFDEQRPVCVEVLCAAALEQEAQWVRQRILELHAVAPGFAFREMAVLVRNTEVLSAFSNAFDAAGIPYVISRGRGFYEAREVKDLVHLLRAIANPFDEISLAAVLRSPLVHASDEALLALKAHGESISQGLKRLQAERGPYGHGPVTELSEPDPKGTPPGGAVPTRPLLGLGAEDCEKLTRFRERLSEWRRRRESVSWDRLLLAALDDCGYECASGARGWANADKFLAQARAASAKMSLDEFVEQLALMRSDNLRERDAPPEDSADAVSVMTVHSAKGLEFPVVFVAALHKGIENSPPVVAFSREYGLGARWRNPASGKEKDDLCQHAIREERRRREEEESNRLLYVAMTRAEQHLVLSFSGAARKNWALRIADRLQLDLGQPREEILTRAAPDGSEWKLRLVVADQVPELSIASAAGPPAANGVAWIAAPPVDEQQEANATVSEVTAFARCPRSYYLGHYLGFEGRPRGLQENGALSAAELGTMVHALLAGAPAPEADPQALALAAVARQSPLGRRAARASRVEREFDFLMAVEGLVVRGQIDLWFEEGGELVLADYKTDAVTAVEAHQRAQDYAVQLRLYALALERLTGRAPDRGWLHFLRPNTAIAVDLTPSLLESPEQVIRDFQEAQDRLEFPLLQGEHCRRCAFYRELCPAGEGETQDEKSKGKSQSAKVKRN